MTTIQTPLPGYDSARTREVPSTMVTCPHCLERVLRSQRHDHHHPLETTWVRRSDDAGNVDETRFVSSANQNARRSDDAVEDLRAETIGVNTRV